MTRENSSECLRHSCHIWDDNIPSVLFRSGYSLRFFLLLLVFMIQTFTFRTDKEDGLTERRPSISKRNTTKCLGENVLPVSLHENGVGKDLKKPPSPSPWRRENTTN